MATAKRNTNGVWEVISEDGDHVTFVEWLGRFFNALDPFFRRTKEASEFDFILCLLRIRHGRLRLGSVRDYPSRDPENREIVGLSAAADEHNFTRVTTEKGGKLAA